VGQVCTNVVLGLPVLAAVCGQYAVPFDLIGCNGVDLLTGSLVLDYTRTWEETLSTGVVDHQVWRFAAKADLALAFSQVPTCPVPDRLVSLTQCFLHGYVDYAFNCPNSTWEAVVVLYHGCDAFQQAPVLSSNPGVFHPSTSYAVVAPDTVANPFVPLTGPPTAGLLRADALRTLAPASGGPCLAEDAIVSGVFTPPGHRLPVPACLQSRAVRRFVPVRGGSLRERVPVAEPLADAALVRGRLRLARHLDDDRHLPGARAVVRGRGARPVRGHL